MKVLATGQIPSVEQIGFALEPALRASAASQAIVFGSYGRGEATTESDLDLLIVADVNERFVRRPRLFRSVRAIWREIWGTGIDIIVLSSEEFAKMENTGAIFLDKISKDGQVIFERGHNSLAIGDIKIGGQTLGDVGYAGNSSC